MNKYIYRYIVISILCVASTALFGAVPDSTLEKRAEKIHRGIFSVDSHTDTPLRMSQEGFDIGDLHDPVTDHSKVDLPRMEEGMLDGAFFAVFVGQGKRTPEGYATARTRADELFDIIYKSAAAHSDKMGIALEPEEGYRLKKEGKRAVFIGIENGYPIGKDISLVESYYRRGARYITLVHTSNNDICDSSNDTLASGGLSPFGREVVAEMNRLGMMIDVSHASDSSFYDVLAASKAPVIASHSCARALCDNPRNLSDPMLKALAANGGVIQMCILSEYVKTPDPNPARDSARAAMRKKFRGFEGLSEEEMKQARKEWYALDDKFPRKLATVSDVCDHIDHIVKVAGIDHVGIGTDFDGGGGVEDCFDVSGMKNITVELLRRGYSASDLRKIWGGNLFRVWKEVEKTAKKNNHVS